MSNSMLVNNIPYHSRTTIYSQNQDPPPTSLRQFHHPPRETPPKAERVARSSSSSSSSGSSNDPFPSSSLFPSPLPFTSPLLSPFLCMLSHSFLSTLLSRRSRAASAAAAFGASDGNIKEAKNEKRKRGGETDKPMLGETGEAKLA